MWAKRRAPRSSPRRPNAAPPAAAPWRPSGQLPELRAPKGTVSTAPRRPPFLGNRLLWPLSPARENNHRAFVFVSLRQNAASQCRVGRAAESTPSATILLFFCHCLLPKRHPHVIFALRSNRSLSTQFFQSLYQIRRFHL